jgi:hypothetical protein
MSASRRFLAVKAVLEAAGVEFLNHGQPGVRLQEYEVGSCMHKEPGVYLRLGAGGARKSFSYREAQEEALRQRRQGNNGVPTALMSTSPNPAVTSLPQESGDGSGARLRKAK